MKAFHNYLTTREGSILNVRLSDGVGILIILVWRAGFLTKVD
jgi:hypothetical protein